MENELRAIVGGMLVGMPLGEPIALVIRAPVIDDQYAGEIFGPWHSCVVAEVLSVSLEASLTLPGKKRKKKEKKKKKGS